MENTKPPAEQPNHSDVDVHNPHEIVFITLSIFAVLLTVYTTLLTLQIQTRRQLFSLQAQHPSNIKPPFELAATEAPPPPDKLSAKHPSPGDLERGRAPPAPSGFDRVTIGGTTGLFQTRNRARNLFPGRRQAAADVERRAVPTMVAEDADWSDHAGSFSADELYLHQPQSPSRSSAIGATLSAPPQLPQFAADQGEVDAHTPLRNRAVSPPASVWASDADASPLQAEAADEYVAPRSPPRDRDVTSLPPPPRSVSVSSAVGATLSAPPQMPFLQPVDEEETPRVQLASDVEEIQERPSSAIGATLSVPFVQPADDEDAAPPAPVAAAAPRRTRRSFREAWAQRTGPSRMEFQGFTAPQWDAPATRVQSPEVSPRTSVAEAGVSEAAPVRSTPVRVASAIPVPVSRPGNARPVRTRAGHARLGNSTKSGLARPGFTRADATSDLARSTPTSPNAPRSDAPRSATTTRSNALRSAATRGGIAQTASTRAEPTRSGAARSTPTSPNAPRSAATRSTPTRPNAPRSAATRPRPTRSSPTRSTATRPNAPRSTATRPTATQSATTQSATTPSGPTTSSHTNINVSPFYVPSPLTFQSSTPRSSPAFSVSSPVSSLSPVSSISPTSPSPLFSPASPVSSHSPTTPPPLTPGTPSPSFVTGTGTVNHGPISPLSPGDSDLETFSASSFSDEGEEDEEDDSDDSDEEEGSANIAAEAVTVGAGTETVTVDGIAAPLRAPVGE